MEIIWPEWIIDGKVPEEMTCGQATADVYTAWANCSFEKPPEKFGKALVDYYYKFNLLPVPDKLPTAKDFNKDGSLKS